MKRLAALALLAASCAPGQTPATVTVTTPTACITSIDGVPTANGTLTVFAPGKNGAAAPFTSTTGLVLSGIAQRSISGGQLQGAPLILPNPAVTSPVNVGYTFTIQDNSARTSTTYASVFITPDGSGNWNICSLQAGNYQTAYPTVFTGGSFTGGNVPNATSFQSTVTLAADPTQNLQAATKHYVDNHAGGIPYPTGSGIPVVASGAGWGTTLAAPAGAIVGTTDTQALTNKTVDGVTPTTFGFLDPTSSVQTQLNGKAATTYVDLRNNTNPASYTFYVSGGITNAVNNATTQIDYSNADAAVVINDVLAVLANTGGTLYFKNGTYNLKSCTLETVAPYTNICYAVGIPSTNATSYPSISFEGESAGIGSQSNPATTGVIFNVTTAAETAAGTNYLSAFWMRPNTACDADYPPFPGSCLYWNDHVSFRNLAVNFQSNTRGKEHGIDMLEASYLHLQHVQVGFVTQPTALGASGTTAIRTPATPSDGVLIEETQVGPGYDVAYEVNTEHSILINTETFEDTTCYYYGAEQSRNLGNPSHSSQFIHPQIYDCVNGIYAGADINPGAQLDIIGLDQQYATSGLYARAITFSPGPNLGGLLSWGNISDAGVIGALSSPFPSGSGGNYQVSTNGVATNGLTSALTGTAASGDLPTISFSTGTGIITPHSTSLVGAVQVTSSGAFTFQLSWRRAGAAFSYPNSTSCTFDVAANNTDWARVTAGLAGSATVSGNTSAPNEYIPYICVGY